MKWKDEILCIIQIQNINTVCNFSDLIKEYEWIKRRTELCNTDRKKQKKTKKKTKKTQANQEPPGNQIKQSMRGGTYRTVRPFHFLLKRLYQARKVYDHVYVY